MRAGSLSTACWIFCKASVTAGSPTTDRLNACTAAATAGSSMSPTTTILAGFAEPYPSGKSCSSAVNASRVCDSSGNVSTLLKPVSMPK